MANFCSSRIARLQQMLGTKMLVRSFVVGVFVVFFFADIHQIRAQPQELWGSGLGIRREDSVNPYCHICTSILTSKEDPFTDTAANPCNQIVPLNEQEICNYVRDSMFNNHDVKLITTNGCVDNTAKDGVPLMFVGPSTCPTLVACNIIQSESEGPMCGPYLRSWGDYIPRFGGWNRPIRPNTLDLAPEYIRKPNAQILRFQESRNAAGNPHCAMCIDIINHVSIYRARDAQTACAQQPLGLKDLCLSIAPDIIDEKNADTNFIFTKGCIDFTTIAPTIRPSAMCPGLVACNLIQMPNGGPYCGTTLGTYGRMNLGAQLGKGGMSNTDSLERPTDGAPMPFINALLQMEEHEDTIPSTTGERVSARLPVPVPVAYPSLRRAFLEGDAVRVSNG
eukprot:g765.t1